MKSIFEPSDYQEIKDRIAKLQPDAQPAWGIMNTGQMLRHCQFPLKGTLYPEDSAQYNFFVRLLLRSFKKSMYDDSQWRKNIPTPKRFKVEDNRDFEEEKKKLLQLIDEFHAARDKTDWAPHPAFGEFTTEQIGKMQYKHLNHHLTQFGV